MSNTDLIKKIIELGKELGESEGFNSVMIVHEMEETVEKFLKSRTTISKETYPDYEYLKKFHDVISTYLKEFRA